MRLSEALFSDEADDNERFNDLLLKDVRLLITFFPTKLYKGERNINKMKTKN